MMAFVVDAAEEEEAVELPLRNFDPEIKRMMAIEVRRTVNVKSCNTERNVWKWPPIASVLFFRFVASDRRVRIVRRNFRPPFITIEA